MPHSRNHEKRNAKLRAQKDMYGQYHADEKRRGELTKQADDWLGITAAKKRMHDRGFIVRKRM